MSEEHTWGDPLSYLTDDLDTEDRHKLVIQQGGNGDWYVSVLPENHRLGPTVRISTSGGAQFKVPGLGIAISRAYRALNGEKDNTSLLMPQDAYLWTNVITGSRTLSFNKDITERQKEEGWTVKQLYA